MKIITRQADNHQDALATARGMENAGASVFSVTFNGTKHPEGAMIPSAQFIVWGKYEEPLTSDEIDKAISKELYA